MPPVFLTLDEVLEIHRNQIETHGGRTGVRDMDLLQSALAMPHAGTGGEFFHADVFEMAAAYLYHIIRNHPFADGNKRVAAMSAFVFLRLNGHTLQATAGAFERLVVAAAEGKVDKATIARFFQEHTTVNP
jgi:death-on-curing protein